VPVMVTTSTKVTESSVKVSTKAAFVRARQTLRRQVGGGMVLGLAQIATGRRGKKRQGRVAGWWWGAQPASSCKMAQPGVTISRSSTTKIATSHNQRHSTLNRSKIAMGLHMSWPRRARCPAGQRPTGINAPENPNYPLRQALLRLALAPRTWLPWPSQEGRTHPPRHHRHLRSAMIWQSWQPTSHYRLPLLTRFQPNHNLACLDNRDNLTQL